MKIDAASTGPNENRGRGPGFLWKWMPRAWESCETECRGHGFSWNSKPGDWEVVGMYATGMDFVEAQCRGNGLR